MSEQMQQSSSPLEAMDRQEVSRAMGATGEEGRELKNSLIQSVALEAIRQNPENTEEIFKALDAINKMNAEVDANAQVHTAAPAAAAEPQRRSIREYLSDQKDNIKDNISAKTKRWTAVGATALALSGLAVAGCSDETDTNKVNTGDPQAQEQKERERAPEATETERENTPQKSEVNLDDLNTVKSAVDRLDVGYPLERRKVLQKHMGTNYKLELNNIDNMMNANDTDLSTDEMLVAAGIAMGSDNREGTNYAKGAVNFIKGRDINASTGMSSQEEERYMERFMTSKNAKTSIDNDYDGLVKNGYMIDGGKMSAQSENFTNERVLVRSVEGMGTLRFKVTRDENGKICLNLVRPVEEERSAPTPTSAPGVTTTRRPTTFTTETTDRVTGRDKKREIVREEEVVREKEVEKEQKQEKEVEKEKEVKQEKEIEKEKEVEKEVKKPVAKEKHDDGKLPGNPNVPADHDKGSGDQWGAGKAPAVPGNTPHPEVKQPQAPAPAPEAPSSVVENRPPAETGEGPAVIDPEGSAKVPGTSNEQGQGGAVDPNAQ